ncbi:RDD family protein [Fulvivirga maritima]|uniref:RDD family protein n=1 Tax=Fulvivirga maritima TaxID=2904247 RepID=UPI003F8E799C
MESGDHQASFGKMTLGIIVTDKHGQKLTFAKATGRYFSKLVSYLTLFVGFIMAGFTEKKQALHDIIAGTLVIKK